MGLIGLAHCILFAWLDNLGHTLFAFWHKDSIGAVLSEINVVHSISHGQMHKELMAIMHVSVGGDSLQAFWFSIDYKTGIQDELQSTLPNLNSHKSNNCLSWRFLSPLSQGFSQDFRIGCPKNTNLGCIGCPIPFYPIALYTNNMDIRVSKIDNRASKRTPLWLKAFSFLYFPLLLTPHKSSFQKISAVSSVPMDLT